MTGSQHQQPPRPPPQPAKVMMMKTKIKEEEWLDQLDPAAIQFRDAKHFRRIVAASKAVDDAKEELQAAVDAAREAGDSWVAIGTALGTTKQNAYQRFGRR